MVHNHILGALLSTVWAFLSPLFLLKLVMELSRAPLAGGFVPLPFSDGGLGWAGAGGGGGLTGGAERIIRRPKQNVQNELCTF